MVTVSKAAVLRLIFDSVGRPATEIYQKVRELPGVEAEPVRHAHLEKRMEEKTGKDYRAFTPVWNCSNCKTDYDSAAGAIVKYCYVCGAKLDGGQDA